jgi:hypothetical protein
MIDDPITLLQIKNAFVFLLNLSILGVFLTILFNDRANYKDAYYQALVGVSVYFFGEAAEQFWYWSWRHFASGDPAWLSDYRMMIVLCLNVVIVVGGVCVIRVFTLQRYGHRLWVAVIVACLALALGSVWLPKMAN